MLEVKTNIHNYENSITFTTEVIKHLPENIREQSLAPIKQLLSEQNDMLETLLRNNHKIPSLIVIIPKFKNWKSIFEPRNIIRTEYSHFFICEHTKRLAPCGEKGDGYKFSQMNQ